MSLVIVELEGRSREGLGAHLGGGEGWRDHGAIDIARPPHKDVGGRHCMSREYERQFQLQVQILIQAPWISHLDFVNVENIGQNTEYNVKESQASCGGVVPIM